jgi:hypothetical protein
MVTQKHAKQSALLLDDDDDDDDDNHVWKKSQSFVQACK